MPTTYLLLRNNKQSRPLSLDELVQHSLKPQDLIWVEGQSAGWSYPQEIEALKAYVNNSGKKELPPQPTERAKDTTSVSEKRGTTASHIYVALPAGMPLRSTEEASTAPNLEAKAEALYNRVQAFAAGQVQATDDVHYAKSLDDMQREYITWQVKQNKKKKSNNYKKKLLVVASVVIVTTSGFAIARWISNNPGAPSSANQDISGSLLPVNHTQTAMASFTVGADSFTTNQSAPLLVNDSVGKQPLVAIKGSKPIVAKKKPVSNEQKQKPGLADTATNNGTPLPTLPETSPPTKEIKKVIPLSRQVFVSGTFDRAAKGQVIKGTQVTLQNNSSETLKSVTVTITYFKKEDREVSKEKVYFVNVLPASAPVVNITPSRRATSATFTISTITRADGSLYLIH